MSKIRKATKNFLCEKCNCLIPANSDYFDWWNKDSNGNYYHRRFHTTCINNIKENKSETKANKPSLIERVEKLLNEQGSFVAVNNDFEKFTVCGTCVNEHKMKFVVLASWENKKPLCLTAEEFKSFRDYNGNYF